MGNLSACAMGGSSTKWPDDDRSSSSASPLLTQDFVKILRADGGVIHLSQPIKVIGILLDYPHHFVCSLDSLKPGQSLSSLLPDEVLQLGHLYLLLPFGQNVCLSSSAALLHKFGNGLNLSTTSEHNDGPAHVLLQMQPNLHNDNVGPTLVTDRRRPVISSCQKYGGADIKRFEHGMPISSPTKKFGNGDAGPSAADRKRRSLSIISNRPPPSRQQFGDGNDPIDIMSSLQTFGRTNGVSSSAVDRQLRLGLSQEKSDYGNEVSAENAPTILPTENNSRERLGNRPPSPRGLQEQNLAANGGRHGSKSVERTKNISKGDASIRHMISNPAIDCRRSSERGHCAPEQPLLSKVMQPGSRMLRKSISRLCDTPGFDQRAHRSAMFRRCTTWMPRLQAITEGKTSASIANAS